MVERSLPHHVGYQLTCALTTVLGKRCSLTLSTALIATMTVDGYISVPPGPRSGGSEHGSRTVVQSDSWSSVGAFLLLSPRPMLGPDTRASSRLNRLRAPPSVQTQQRIGIYDNTMKRPSSHVTTLH